MRFSGSLRGGDLVCQGQAVLRATVEYRLVTAGSAEAVAELIGTAIKSALEGALQTSIAYEDGRLVSGVNLHYGVRINPICATLPTDELPRRLPPTGRPRSRCWRLDRHLTAGAPPPAVLFMPAGPAGDRW